MLFFPYQIDLDLQGVPILTYLLMLVCVVAFLHQEVSFDAYVQQLDAYCQNEVSEEAHALLDSLSRRDSPATCQGFLNAALDERDSPEVYTLALLSESGVSEPVGEWQTLVDTAERAAKQIEPHATQQWIYLPETPSLLRMFTSSLSHGDWVHLASNLVFFLVFAASVELMLGRLVYILVFVATCLSTSLAYSAGLFGADNSLPSLGLSGVVMGYMGVVVLLFPHKMVRVFYWMLIFVGVFRLPLLLLVGTYIAMDLYGLRWLQGESNVGYLSHLVGAATGSIVAVLYLLTNAKRLHQYY